MPKSSIRQLGENNVNAKVVSTRHSKHIIYHKSSHVVTLKLKQTELQILHDIILDEVNKIETNEKSKYKKLIDILLDLELKTSP